MKNAPLLIAFLLALLAIAGWQSVSQKRQAWEYKGFTLLLQGTTVTMYESGKPVAGKADAAAKAAELGNEGWELVSVSSWGEGSMHYWFKRPK